MSSGGEIIHLVSDVAADFLLGIPATVLSAAFRRYREGQITTARDVLLDQMRAGSISSFEAAQEDEKIEILYRYFIAARDGAARRNLRLLARVMVGLAMRDALYTDTFNRYADICARLTRDQIFVIGRLAPHFKGRERDAFAKIQTDIYNKFIVEMVPAHFATPDHLRVVIWQLNGLGLAQGVPWEETMFQPSTLLEEIVHLADFDDLIRREAQQQ